MVDPDFISIVIPAFNARSFVRRTIDSALNQTHDKIEVVVVDDGSSDDTAAIVSEVARRDNRVRLIRTPRRGVSAARNLAISEATGDLIATLDADDVWHIRKLERQLAALKSASAEVGLVYCWSVGIDDEERVILPAWNKSAINGAVLNEIIVQGILGNGSTPLMRRGAILATGGYDETLSLCEDWKFYTEMAAVCQFVVVPAFLTGYRLRDDSSSLSVRNMEHAIAEVTGWIKRRWPNLPPDVLRDRRHIVNAYLATLAIRSREFSGAVHYLSQALRARPSKIVDLTFVRLVPMLAMHAAGLRIYRWDFWSKPTFSDFCSLKN